MKLRIGTRGSDLALWQARHVAEVLARSASVEVEIVVLKTRGDAIDDVPLTQVEGKAFFTAEIERALLDGRVDLAVHSHKDLPSESPAGLAIAAVPPRGPHAERLLVAPAACDPAAAFLPLRLGARLGTSAPRRAEQLLALRPDLDLRPLRGNVPTRVARLREGRHDAIVLAAAGLDRLGLDLSDLHVLELPVSWCVPAPAQGALAVQAREDDLDRIALCRRALHDEPTARAVAAERSLLVRAGGGCNLPLGALVLPAEGRWRAHAFLGAGHPSPEHGPRWAEAVAADPEQAVARVYERLVAREPTRCGPLEGLRIALTGSSAEGTSLGARLAELGGDVVHERVIAFEDLPAAPIAPRLASLRPGDAVAVTSRQAARFLRGARLPEGVLLAAVGPGSARALAEQGLRADVVGEGGARELAVRLDLAPGAQVLFPCAEGAREELEQELARRGFAVERCELYRSAAVASPRLDESAAARVYMSPSSVDAALPWERAHPRSRAARIGLGRTTSDALRRAGLGVAEEVCPPSGEPRSLTEALVQRLASLVHCPEESR